MNYFRATLFFYLTLVLVINLQAYTYTCNWFAPKIVPTCDITPVFAGTTHNQALQAVYNALHQAIINNNNQSKPPLTSQQLKDIAINARNSFLTQTCSQFTPTMIAQYADISTAGLTQTIANSSTSQAFKTAVNALLNIANQSTSPAQTRLFGRCYTHKWHECH
ncbi:MAG: hypothetical protein EAZ67_07155 [Cytophagales bacterium]|nr:MAG: hypothetical protein EAZ67_07155 [Cytophagales bacterium]